MSFNREFSGGEIEVEDVPISSFNLSNGNKQQKSTAAVIDLSQTNGNTYGRIDNKPPAANRMPPASDRASYKQSEEPAPIVGLPQPPTAPKKAVVEDAGLFWYKQDTSFLSDQRFRLLTDYQRGWLFCLMMSAHKAGGYLPGDGKALAIIAESTKASQFSKEKSKVLEFFEIQPDGRYKHPGLHLQYVAAQVTQQINHERAVTASAAAKVKRDAETTAKLKTETIQ